MVTVTVVMVMLMTPSVMMLLLPMIGGRGETGRVGVKELLRGCMDRWMEGWMVG